MNQPCLGLTTVQEIYTLPCKLTLPHSAPTGMCTLNPKFRHVPSVLPHPPVGVIDRLSRTTDFYADTDWDSMAHELILDQLKGLGQRNTTEAESGGSTECTLSIPYCHEFSVVDCLDAVSWLTGCYTEQGLSHLYPSAGFS